MLKIISLICIVAENNHKICALDAHASIYCELYNRYLYIYNILDSIIFSRPISVQN